MLIKDSWIHTQRHKTAVYCDEIGDTNITKAKTAFIDGKEYSIIDSEVLTSIAGNTNAVLLLDTSELIEFPQEIILQ